MNIPECITAALFAAAVFTIIFRLKLSLGKTGGRDRWEKGCDYVGRRMGVEEEEYKDWGRCEVFEGMVSALHGMQTGSGRRAGLDGGRRRILVE